MTHSFDCGRQESVCVKAGVVRAFGPRCALGSSRSRMSPLVRPRSIPPLSNNAATDAIPWLLVPFRRFIISAAAIVVIVTTLRKVGTLVGTDTAPRYYGGARLRSCSLFVALSTSRKKTKRCRLLQVRSLSQTTSSSSAPWPP